jgi:hypothetical protein
VGTQGASDVARGPISDVPLSMAVREQLEDVTLRQARLHSDRAAMGRAPGSTSATELVNTSVCDYTLWRLLGQESMATLHATSMAPFKCRAALPNPRIAQGYIDCQGRVQHPCATTYLVYAPRHSLIGSLRKSQQP